MPRSDLSGFTDITDNPILDTDSYKVGHPDDYPPGLCHTFSYIEDRQGAKFDGSLFFGLQYTLKRYLCRRITQAMVDEAAELVSWHIGPSAFPVDRWQHIVDAHHGRLPVIICAAPEGMWIPVGNVNTTVEVTCEQCAWVPGWIETRLIRSWYPRAVATQSFYAKTTIGEWLDHTAEDPEAELPFKLHGFGSRACSCPEQAGIGDMGHMVNFLGTDTMQAIRFAQKFYGAKRPAFSIRAKEHSTVLTFGPGWANEMAAYRHTLEEAFKRDEKLVACVADSYNVWKAIEKGFCEELLPLIKQMHGSNGLKVVIRLDSGDPIAAVLQALNVIQKTLGNTGDRKTGIWTNSKGYKVLPDFFGLLQGDGVALSYIDDIYRTMASQGWSASCLGFGMGSEMVYSGVKRDTQRTAMKPSYIEIKQDTRTIGFGISKNPIDDPTKASKRGILALVRDDNGTLHTVDNDRVKEFAENVLVPVYCNGDMAREWTWDEVVTRAAEEYKRAKRWRPLAG